MLTPLPSKHAHLSFVRECTKPSLTMKTSRCLPVIMWAIIMVASALPPLTKAADRFWTNAASGTFHTPANWLGSLVPGAADNANFTNNATYQVTWADDVTNANAFFNASSGVVTQSVKDSIWLLTNSYVVGRNAGSSPTILHNSATLRVTNAARLGVLEVRRGTNRLNDGLIEVDQLVLTNTAGRFEFNGGTLITRGGFISNNLPFTVGVSGVIPAIWNARAGGNVVLSSNLVIGDNVPGCQLILTNGGKVFNQAGTIGSNGNANGSSAWVAGAGSVWSNSGSLLIGNSGRFNRLVVSNAGTVFSAAGIIGSALNAHSNAVFVVGGVWNGGSNVIVGNSSGFNQLVISNAGKVFNSDGTIGDNSLANTNVVLVTGADSVWTNSNSLLVGNSARVNQLVISNAGRVFSPVGTIGNNATATRNTVLVTGTGSVWSNSISLILGSAGSFSRLVITNGGRLFANALTIGATSASTNNQLLVDGGTLRVTNSSATAALDIRRGTNQLNSSGFVQVDLLRVTNTLGIFEFNGGTLNVRTSAVANAQTFFVGDAASAAILNLVGNGTHSFANRLTLRNHSTLIGNGSIQGLLTVESGGTLAPGASSGTIGRVVLADSPALEGTTRLDIQSGPNPTNDQIHVTAPLTYGGSLVVNHLGGTLTAGDHFVLFTATSFAGTFSSLTLPALLGGLAWTNKLHVDGSIEVVAIPPPAVERQIFPLLGTGWKYLDDGTDQGTPWRGSDFDDSGWSNGIAQLGFGDGDEATVIRQTNSLGHTNITCYFRHAFHIASPASIPNLFIRFRRDDGIVVYLNGTEIIRDNMPEGAAVAWSTLASTDAFDDGDQVFTRVLSSELIVGGNNVIAAEVHQRDRFSTDLTFALGLSTLNIGTTFLVNTRQSWKYLDDGTDQGAVWRTLAFNDSGWSNGLAELGFGDGDEATVVSSNNSLGVLNNTCYFRRTFEVPSTSSFNLVWVRLRRDDGAVVYINNAEVFRSNMPTGTVEFGTFAESVIDDNAFHDAVLPVDILRNGQNLVAAEVHQAALVSSDLSFDLQIIGLSEIGPFLNVALTTTNSVMVFWPSPSTGFRLQQNMSLSPTGWGAPAESVTDDGMFKFIIVNSPTENRFYRLIKP